MRKENLKDHKKSNCYVVFYDNGRIEFWSYSTMVIAIENGNIQCTGTYSATTRKQIGWFLKQYMPDLSYYNMKAIAGMDPVSIDDARVA